MNHRRSFTALTGLCLLQALPLVLAHGDEPHNAMPAMPMGDGHGCGGIESMSGKMVMKNMEDLPDVPSYFLHSEHSGLVLAHIAIEVVAWTVVLPVSVMFSIARSRLNLPSQLVFLILNAIGVFLGVLYNSQTPDLYENNAHHKIGWAVTWIALVWALLGLLTVYTRRRDVGPAWHPTYMAEYQGLNPNDGAEPSRWSQDSGQGTEPNTDSLFSSSRSNSWSSDRPISTPDKYKQKDGDEQKSETRAFLRDTAVDRFLSRNVGRFAAGRVGRATNVTYISIERSMIPLAFLTVLTGIVTYSGISRGGRVFGVLAHLIKGGIFFGYGLLTFGRWMGSFSDLGWAWNLKPGRETVRRSRARTPSAEFVESFVIFFYGASNVFLEHLGAWGKRWSAMDLEHVSITIMFFGGGLLGMLVESSRVRTFLNRALENPDKYARSHSPEWQTPKSYAHPLNPIPSLVILLLGIMMSNHTQHSDFSGQMHKQWGLLFAGFAVARSMTYVTLWLKPPQTYLPTRPPTELIASFCLVSGGAIFMASNQDTIDALEKYKLDAMFVFNVMMGLTCLIMAWTMTTIAVKGWASRRRFTSSLDSIPSLLSPTSPA